MFSKEASSLEWNKLFSLRKVWITQLKWSGSPTKAWHDNNSDGVTEFALYTNYTEQTKGRLTVEGKQKSSALSRTHSWSWEGSCGILERIPTRRGTDNIFQGNFSNSTAINRRADSTWQEKKRKEKKRKEKKRKEKKRIEVTANSVKRDKTFRSREFRWSNASYSNKFLCIKGGDALQTILVNTSVQRLPRPREWTPFNLSLYTKLYCNRYM